MTAPTPGVVAREADPSEWSSRALTRRLADYLVNAYTDGRGYDPADLDDVEVTLGDGFDIVLGEMRAAQRDRSDGGGSEDSTTASEYPATAEPPSAPVSASAAALDALPEVEAERDALRAESALVARLTEALADLSEALADAQQDNEGHMHEYRLMCDRLRTYGRHWAACDYLRDSDLGCDCGWTALAEHLRIVDVTDALRLAAEVQP